MKEQLTIGINILFQHSFFSHGLPTTAFSLADALTALGYKVVLVNLNGTNEWFDDCLNLKDVYERRNIIEWSEKKYSPLDIFIDIDGFIIPVQRKSITKRVVVFIRKPVFLSEMEACIYPIQQPIRNIRDCDAIWTWDHFGTQDIHLLELLSKKPVYQIPFTWSEHGVKSYGASLPSWLEISTASENWIGHITETNVSVSSSCTLPLVIAGYAKTHSKLPTKVWMIHNAETIEKQQFFKDNILAHCRRDGVTFEFLGRQRISDWRQEPKSFILSHMRFVSIKSYLLDSIWNGIPVIHNSPFLKELGCGLEQLYYEDNSVTGASKAFDSMLEAWTLRTGVFAPGALETIRNKLKSQLNPLQHRSSWEAAVSFSSSPVNLNPVLANPIVSSPVVVNPVAVNPRTELVVGISDQWQDYNYTYNFWYLLLQTACPTLKVRTFQVTTSNLQEHMDLLLFGPFGSIWTQVPASIPKVATTGENVASKQGNGIYLNLGFEATDLSKGIYRFPLWLQYIDWFGADQDRIVNPKSIPVDSCKAPSLDALKQKTKFCAFVVTNPSNPIRNDSFHQLNTYKPVDSAGRLYNNVGDRIFSSTGGGGGGELKKFEFLQDYKFCLTYENSRTDGYITEKFLAAKAAGCIPIYWGALNVDDDFAKGSFLNVNDKVSTAELVEAVKAIDTDPLAWETMATTPSINIEKERARLAEAAKHILERILGSSYAYPSLLGASSTAEAAELRLQREGPIQTETWNGNTLLVTFATQRFLPSLQGWLESVKLFHAQDSKKNALVYIGTDVDEFQFNLLRSEYVCAEFRRLPTTSVAVNGFPDLWEPQHFAWKLWIYQHVVQDPIYRNTLVWYTDVGSCIVRWPQEWLSIAANQGICVLEDKEQKNDQWCHQEFCKRLQVTQEEKSAQQIVGGILAFLAGSRKAVQFFQEAWSFGQDKEVIVGPKWAGVLADGRPYGHRHDQSILSILRLRHELPRYPLEKIYNHESLRRTFKDGQSLYVHRGQFKEHVEFAPGIGEVHIISLPRRQDRIKRFKESHESWTKQVFLRPAYDGRSLELTPQLAHLFAPNDFLWKKAILGCALSHLSLWLDLAMEQPSCSNYLILEDDVIFQKDWLSVWNNASKVIPEDYDVLYLGGVLPPNKQGFQTILEPINAHWSRIQQNSMFGQQPPTRYFHFCNYAYILSRKGAQTILEAIQKEGGYKTSADHMVCNRITTLKHYVLTPLVAKCYQDEDPKYQTSVFNNFNRVDQFDSDLWNNDDRFSAEEIQSALRTPMKETKLNLQDILVSARNPIQQVASNPSSQIYTIEPHTLNSGNQMEFSWLEACLGTSLEAIPSLPATHTPLRTNPIFVVCKPFMETYKSVFAAYETAGCAFYAIHLSDEFVNDPIDWYTYKSCKGVLRNYVRQDCVTMKHVYTIPLGPYRTTKEVRNFENRPILWSFFGTDWQGRQHMLEPWKQLQPHKAAFFPSWNDSNQVSAEFYSDTSLHSIFMPCPKGQHVETFRFWEALEHGAIPIYIRCQGDELYYAFLTEHLPILSIPSWEHAVGTIQTLLQNKETLVQYRTMLLQKWLDWKTSLRVECRRVLDLTTSP